jgi:ubiquinone/menaquinone biosynthesis C-methylase UbiE
LSNPLANPEPWSLVAAGYQEETVPAFRQYCQKAIGLSGYKPGSRVLDVACGPGTLSLMLAESAASVSAIDFSDGMLDIFRTLVPTSGHQNIQIHKMDGQKLEFQDNEFDFAFSMFGLMFFPDRLAGFREIYRTLKPGGRAAISSWAPVSDSPVMQLMFGSLRAAFPERPEPKTNMLSLENPDLFKEEMEKSGFRDVVVTPFNGEWLIGNAEKFLDSMVRGSAPLELMRKNLPEGVWPEKRKLIQAHLEKNLPPLPAKLHSKAFIATGTK